MRKRKWSIDQLRYAVSTSRSFRQVLSKLGLVEAGGNYDQVHKYIKEYNISTDHFTGRGWSIGMRGGYKPRVSLVDILVKDSMFQSFKLKKRLFAENIKQKSCEKCGWAQMSDDGRIPLELDHINGDRHDNRIENLRVLCPNCHSLCPTHRGRNMQKRRDGEIGRHPTLKML